RGSSWSGFLVEPRLLAGPRCPTSHPAPGANPTAITSLPDHPPARCSHSNISPTVTASRRPSRTVRTRAGSARHYSPLPAAAATAPPPPPPRTPPFHHPATPAPEQRKRLCAQPWRSARRWDEVPRLRQDIARTVAATDSRSGSARGIDGQVSKRNPSALRLR